MNATVTQLHVAPQTNHAPSIASSALLAELSIGIWEGRKKDKKATNDVTSRNNAKKNAAR